MKFSAVILCVTAATTSAFSVVPKGTTVTRGQALNSVGIYYSTSTGNTETVAEYISSAVGGVEIEDIGSATADEIKGHDGLIVGAPTWVCFAC